jgi:hypothetical protein
MRWAPRWFKARVGLNMVELPREVAFCAYTILRLRWPCRTVEQDPAHQLAPAATGSS